MIFKAVRINYRIEDRIDFCFLAEFFRLAGIYVVECLEGEDKSPYLNANCYDVVIETRGIVEQLEDNSIDFRGLKQEITDMINIRKWNCLQQASVLSKLIGHIYESLLGNNIVSLSWQKIINIYVSEELVLHSMNLQYFFKKTSSPVDNAKAAYMKACQKLSNEEKEILEEEEKRYYRYAICSCKVKVNSACYFMGNDVAFPIEQLGDECIKYIHEYPDFSNFKVLLGLCYEYAPEFIRDAVYTFAEALEDINMDCYSSHIYYWIGKRYEITNVNQKEAIDSYKKSFNRKQRYKNIYKLAVAERESGNFQQSINYFQKIIASLNRKRQLNFLDPLELEYYFKVYTMIAVIYFADLKDYFLAIKYSEFLLYYYKRSVEESEFYDCFYGVDADEYREITIQRCNMKKVRSILFYAYQHLGLIEKAEYYFNMEE